MKKIMFSLLAMLCGVMNVAAQQLPADLESAAFTATVDANDPYMIVLEVALPTKNSEGGALTVPITKVELGEMNPMSMETEVFYTEDAEEVLIPGTKFQYVVENATNGHHIYSVQVYTEDGSNNLTMVAIYVGTDQPGMAQNVQAVATEGGIVVTWDAPAEGMNGGDMGNPATFTYTITRGADIYDETAVVIAKDIKELTITDNTSFDEESKFVYLVTTTGPYGTGYPSASNEIVVGAAAQLPFAEDFDAPFDEYGNTTTRHSTWSKDASSSFCAWQIGQNTYIQSTEVKPHSGGGLLYAYYSPWGEIHQWDAYTTGNIDFSSAAAPAIAFWLYDLALGGSPVSIKIQTSTDGVEFATAETIVLGNARENAWREVVVPLDALKGAARGKVRILAEANGSGCLSIALDDVYIGDGIETAISSISSRIAPSAAYNLSGLRAGKHDKGIVIVDGKKIMR